ncbi:low-density lipo receptor class A domain-containing 2, partial [Pelobates cultripes]
SVLLRLRCTDTLTQLPRAPRIIGFYASGVSPNYPILVTYKTLGRHPPEKMNLVDFCGQTIKSDGMIVKSHGDSRKYYFVSMGTDCRLTMQASALKDKVQFQFRFFLVYSLLRMSNSPTSGPGVNNAGGPSSTLTTKGPHVFHDPCNSGSYVQFYDGKDQNSEPLGTPLCGKTIPRPVLSTGNYLTLRLVTRGQQPRVDFVGDFTSFRLGFNTSECSSEPYFPCQNGKCIPSSLVCDSTNVDNCGDGSDQSAKAPANCMQLSGDARGGISKEITTPTGQCCTTCESCSKAYTICIRLCANLALIVVDQCALCPVMHVFALFPTWMYRTSPKWRARIWQDRVNRMAPCCQYGLPNSLGGSSRTE